MCGTHSCLPRAHSWGTFFSTDNPARFGLGPAVSDLLRSSSRPGCGKSPCPESGLKPCCWRLFSGQQSVATLAVVRSEIGHFSHNLAGPALHANVFHACRRQEVERLKFKPGRREPDSAGRWLVREFEPGGFRITVKTAALEKPCLRDQFTSPRLPFAERSRAQADNIDSRQGSSGRKSSHGGFSLDEFTSQA